MKGNFENCNERMTRFLDENRPSVPFIHVLQVLCQNHLFYRTEVENFEVCYLKRKGKKGHRFNNGVSSDEHHFGAKLL